MSDFSTRLQRGGRNFLSQLLQWQETYRGRRHLLELDDAHLKDLGLSRADAMREGRKAFWRS